MLSVFSNKSYLKAIMYHNSLASFICIKLLNVKHSMKESILKILSTGPLLGKRACINCSEYIAIEHTSKAV